MTDNPHKRLVIDLAKCERCGESATGCDVPGLRERATFALICRRCVLASCIIACPFNALERQDSGGVIKRHNLRCVSCKLCALACPFGTIYDELLPFYESPPQEQESYCLAGCPEGALEYRVVDPCEQDVHIIDDQLAARARVWTRLEKAGEVAV